MKFNQFQFLKSQLVHTLQEQGSHQYEPVSVEVAMKMDAVMLAYIGDAVYSLYVREQVLQGGIYKVQVLHTIVTACICAKAQSQALQYIASILTDEEQAVARRARNSHVNVPKSASVQEYRSSTAFEAVLGFLYKTNQQDRLRHLMDLSFTFTMEQL